MMTDEQKRIYLRTNQWTDVSRAGLELWEPPVRPRMVPFLLDSACKTQTDWDALNKTNKARIEAEHERLIAKERAILDKEKKAKPKRTAKKKRTRKPTPEEMDYTG